MWKAGRSTRARGRAKANGFEGLRTASAWPPPFTPLRTVANGINCDRADSALLIDATRRADLPAVAVPAKEHMERARLLGEDLGLPPLRPRSPWFGYSLGLWSEVSAAEAELAV